MFPASHGFVVVPATSSNHFVLDISNQLDRDKLETGLQFVRLQDCSASQVTLIYLQLGTGIGRNSDSQETY